MPTNSITFDAESSARESARLIKEHYVFRRRWYESTCANHSVKSTEKSLIIENRIKKRLKSKKRTEKEDKY